MENEVLKAIKERRSIRRYKADQITDEELKAVLEANMASSRLIQQEERPIEWAANIILPRMRLPSLMAFALLSGAKTMTMVGAP